jgi:hypothetical protein
VLNLTGRGGFEGLVELLDTKVLDPRLLRRLLRHQASVLVLSCFTQSLQGFRFEAGRNLPPLYSRLPLDVSVLALLIEGALSADESEVPECSDSTRFSRKPIRGQNLDRGGLSAQHAKVFGHLSESVTCEDLVQQTGWDRGETRRVLYGLQLADLVEISALDGVRQVIVFEPHAGRAQQIREAFARNDRYSGKVVRDRLALHLLVKRNLPAALVIDLDVDQVQEIVDEIRRPPAAASVKWIGTTDDQQRHNREGFTSIIGRPVSADAVIAALDHAFDKTTNVVQSVAEEAALCHR